MDEIDNILQEIPCPSCRHVLKQTIGWIKKNPHYTCICGKTTDFSVEEKTAAEEISNISKAAEELGRKFH